MQWFSLWLDGLSIGLTPPHGELITEATIVHASSPSADLMGLSSPDEVMDLKIKLLFKAIDN